MLSVMFHDAFGVVYLALSIVGLTLIVLYRKNVSSRSLLISAGFAAVIWLAIQSKYWYYGWTPYLPYYDPTFHAAETFAMTLGALVLLKSHDVVDVKFAKGNAPGALKSIATGVLLGIPFAIVNVLIYVFVYGDAITIQNVIYECIIALQPGVLEEVAYRLLLMSVSLVVMLRYLPGKVAVISAIAMAVVFHAAVHVPDMIASQPVVALLTIVVMSLVFGLPMALLAYKKDIESAMGFHWVIDAVRFSLGL